MYTSLSFIVVVCSLHTVTLDENTIEKGRQLLKQSKYQEAVECLSAAIENNLVDAEAYYLRGRAFQGLLSNRISSAERMMLRDRAMSDFDQSIRLAPKYAEAYQSRGLLYSTKQDYKKALADLTKAIELAPNDPMNYFWRGCFVHTETGAYAATRKDFEKAYDLSDTDLVIDMRRKNLFIGDRLVWLLATCPDDKVRDGKKALEIALKVKEHYDKDKLKKLGRFDQHGSEMIAAAYAELGKFQEAVEWQKKAIFYLSQKGDLLAQERAEIRLQSYEMKEPLRYNSTLDWN